MWETYKNKFKKHSVTKNCSDLSLFPKLFCWTNSQHSASNFKSFSRSVEQFFLTVGQKNFGNKIPIFTLMSELKLSTANISPTDAAGLTSIFCAFDLSFCGTAYSLATSKYMYFLFAKDLLSQKKYIAVKYWQKWGKRKDFLRI